MGDACCSHFVVAGTKPSLLLYSRDFWSYKTQINNWGSVWKKILCKLAVDIVKLNKIGVVWLIPTLYVVGVNVIIKLHMFSVWRVIGCESGICVSGWGPGCVFFYFFFNRVFCVKLFFI